MPVLVIECPDCGHDYHSLVVEGAKVPDVWACSQCGGRRAAPKTQIESTHPWASSCMDGCCG